MFEQVLFSIILLLDEVDREMPLQSLFLQVLLERVLLLDESVSQVPIPLFEQVLFSIFPLITLPKQIPK